MKKETKYLIAGILLTYLLGMYGYSLCLSSSFLDCLYATTLLFFMNLSVDVEQINIYLEIARWSALIISSSVILSVLKTLLLNYRYAFTLRNPELVILHGTAAAKLKKHFKQAVVFDHPILWKAKRHVIAFEHDQQTLDYLSENTSFLDADAQVTLMTSSISRNDYTKQNIQICSLPEIWARAYWKMYPVEKKDEIIIIAGNGHYCKTLLDYAIMLNVMSTDSHIQYHVFLKDSDYLKHHCELESCLSVNEINSHQDSLLFYQDSLKNYRELIEKADRLILIHDQDEINLNMMNDLMKHYTVQQLDIKANTSSTIHDLYGKHIRVVSLDDLMDEDTILNEKTMKQAKQIHAAYYKNYACPSKCEKNCLVCASFLKDWNTLSPFLRYSNVSQADHITMKKRILAHMMEDSCFNIRNFYLSLNENQLLELDEIEHIRWSRYHYLNNWKMGEHKDKIRKTHPLLVPFDELSYEEVLKDRDTWKSAVNTMEK